jgi:exodeoxyribonuclease VII small subunit
LTSDQQRNPEAVRPDPARPGPDGPDSGGPADDRTFEDLMADLESITERLAAGDLGIEAAADLFERAETLHALATERLSLVKARVERMAVPPAPPG